MLNAKQFASRLESIRKADEKFRQIVAEALAFAVFHARNHGQKTPFMQLQAAAPGWLQKDLAKVALGKKKITEAECEYEAEFRVAEWFATHNERKALNNARRTAKKVTQSKTVEAEEPVVAHPAVEEAIEGEAQVVSLESALIIGGQIVELTAGEADALYDTLMAMRGKLRIAA
jgi:hypothetical protein